jgi:bacterioferritin-associated ferredoxin
MNPDDELCLCFHVSLRKVVNYCRRERPPVASLISECLGAGTGCGWCVPFLKRIHADVKAGSANPDLPFSPEEYANRRSGYRATGIRPDEPNDPGDGQTPP